MEYLARPSSFVWVYVDGLEIIRPWKFVMCGYSDELSRVVTGVQTLSSYLVCTEMNVAYVSKAESSHTYAAFSRILG